MFRVALHYADKIRDKICPALQHGIHISLCRLHRLPASGQTIIADSQASRQYKDHNTNDREYFLHRFFLLPVYYLHCTKPAKNPPQKSLIFHQNFSAISFSP